jgi:putative DNA primase/helicase
MINGDGSNGGAEGGSAQWTKEQWTEVWKRIETEVEREEAAQADWEEKKKKKETTEEAEGNDEKKAGEDQRSEYLARIAELAALYVTSRLEYDRKADSAAAEFKTKRKVVDADVKLWLKKNKPERKTDGDQRSQLQRLIEIGTSCTLWHDRDGEAYVTLANGNHVEHHRVNSESFRNWLRKAYGEKYAVKSGGRWIKQMPGTAALKEAVEALRSLAITDGREQLAAFRVAGSRKEILIDLGQPDWRVAKVTREGVVIIPNPGLFRPGGQHPLPMPANGVDRKIGDLRRSVNVSDEDFVLLVGYMLAAFSPGPYRILIISGEEGSAKTTLCRVIKRTIDPDKADLRTPPKSVEELMIAARQSFLVAFDNVSFLPPDLSDAMCRLSTGGTLAKRTLYTDADEFVISACRPQLLNGIPDTLASRSDLLDRSILLKAPAIANCDRKAEEEFWREFEEAKPYILGHLLKGVHAALRHAAEIVIDDPPRLVDFVKFAEAGCRALGFKEWEFTDAYKLNRDSASRELIEDNPVARALILLVESGEEFVDTAAKLLERLELHACSEPKLKQHPKWPKDATRLSGVLRRCARALRQAGVEILFDQTLNRTNQRGIKIRRVPLNEWLNKKGRCFGKGV